MSRLGSAVLGEGGRTRWRALSVLRATLLLAGTAFLQACGGSSASYRFKLIVEVETPTGPRSGSSVLQVTATREMLPMAHTRPIHIELNGEAVPVDLDDGKTFFLSLRTPAGTNNLASAVTLALAPEISIGKASDRPQRFINATRRLGGRAEPRRAAMLPREEYPIMIRFKDPKDPKSATVLDPDNLAQELGAGVVLKRIMVEVSTEPVTQGVKKRLPSFAPETGFAAWRVSLPNDDPRRNLARNDFMTGVDK